MDPLLDLRAKIKVVDVETTTQEGDPDWIHASNRTVMMGVFDPDWNTGGRPLIAATSAMMQVLLGLRDCNGAPTKDALLFVGHHLAFDIGYLVKEGVVDQRTLARRVQIWDTMVAEYILSGQTKRFISLEDACQLRGIPFKKNELIAKHFEEGKGAASVPVPELHAYLCDDIKAAHSLFLKQYEEAEATGMLPLIAAMMDFRLATIDMRMNGINLDPVALKNTKTICENQIESQRNNIANAHSLLQKASDVLYDEPLRRANLDPTKGPQLANLLFGGTYKQREIKTVGTYKNGKDKTKIVESDVSYAGLLHNLGFITPNEERSVDEEALTELMDKLLHTMAACVFFKKAFSAKVAELLEYVLAYRKAVKILSTYVCPSELDAMRFGNRLHPTIHVTPTPTGRTSCSSPNLQNVPKKSLGFYRRAIVAPHASRLVEFDYKQLEVVALAVLTKDRQLVADLKEGIDMHTELFRQVHGRIPNSEERTDFKRAVFCLIYGGGSVAIAAQGNTTRARAGLLLVKFRERYPDTMRFREAVLSEVEKSSVVSPNNKYGIPHRVGTYRSPTKRMYVFEQKVYDKLTFGHVPHRKVEKRCDWSKQEIANYPIQGLATADIVPLMIGMLYRFVWSDEFKSGEGTYSAPPLLRIPVHDSVLVDVAIGTLHRDVGLMKTFLERVPEQMATVFGLDCLGLPFKVGASVGLNWEDMFDYKGEVK